MRRAQVAIPRTMRDVVQLRKAKASRDRVQTAWAGAEVSTRFSLRIVRKREFREVRLTQRTLIAQIGFATRAHPHVVFAWSTGILNGSVPAGF
jgi:hypothetical protein